MAIIGNVSLTVTDEAAFNESLDRINTLADTAVEHGGRCLVKGGSLEVIVGASRPDRVMVVEFEHVGQARSWMSSAEFAELRQLASACSDLHVMVVEGV